MYLWRAVDHEGEVPTCWFMRRRDKRGGNNRPSHAPKKQGFTPKLTEIAKLGSYGSCFPATP